MEKAYKLEFQSNMEESLKLVSCGCSKTNPLHSFGPAIRPHYIIHYILRGKGKFSIGGKTYPLNEGYGFMIQPGEITHYQADEEDPWTYIWVGFTGKEASNIVKSMGLSIKHPIFSSEKGKELHDIVYQMMEYHSYDLANDLKRNGLLRFFLGNIVEMVPVVEKTVSDKRNQYIQTAMEYIRSNYCNPIKVQDIADYVCINRSYLSTLFQANLDMSPQKMLTNYRIAKAKELLQVSDFPIESIALSCGYKDPLVFSKVFRRNKGVSPSTYRKKFVENNKRHMKSELNEIEKYLKCKDPV